MLFSLIKLKIDKVQTYDKIVFKLIYMLMLLYNK